VPDAHARGVGEQGGRRGPQREQRAAGIVDAVAAQRVEGDESRTDDRDAELAEDRSGGVERLAAVVDGDDDVAEARPSTLLSSRRNGGRSSACRLSRGTAARAARRRS
jgi:hypothetical protein